MFIVFLVISVVQIGLAVVFTLKLKNSNVATPEKGKEVEEESEEIDQLDIDYKSFKRSVSKEL